MDKELPEVTDREPGRSPTNNLPEVISSQQDNLPSEIPELPQPDYDIHVSDREIKAIDILQNKYNFSLLALAAKQARGVDSLIKCALAIDRMQERRRHLLNIAYGAPSTVKKEAIVYPID